MIGEELRYWRWACPVWGSTRSRLIKDDAPLRCVPAELSPEDFAKYGRIEFPMPRFVLVGIPAKFLAAQEQTLVDGRFELGSVLLATRLRFKK